MRRFTTLILSIVVFGLVFASPVFCAMPNAGNYFKLNGTWVGGNTDYNTILSITFIPSAPNNEVVSFSCDLAQTDLTLGGIFNEVSNQQNMSIRGDAVRTGIDSFAIKGIFYARDSDRKVVYILVSEGSLTFLDSYKYEETVVDSLFLPDQDADGDGLPDDGEEPIFSFTITNTMKRLLP